MHAWTWLAANPALLVTCVSVAPTPTFLKTSPSTEVKSARRVLSVLKALTKLNTASPVPTIPYSLRRLRAIAFFAALELLKRFTVRKVAHLAVNSLLRSKALSNAHALVLTEFTLHSITHAVARLASTLRTLTM